MHGKLFIVESFIDRDYGIYEFREPIVCTRRETALDALRSDLVSLIVRNPDNLFSEHAEIPSEADIAESIDNNKEIEIVCDDDELVRLVYKVFEKDLIVNLATVDAAK